GRLFEVLQAVIRGDAGPVEGGCVVIGVPPRFAGGQPGKLAGVVPPPHTRRRVRAKASSAAGGKGQRSVKWSRLAVPGRSSLRISTASKSAPRVEPHPTRVISASAGP